MPLKFYSIVSAIFLFVFSSQLITAQAYTQIGQSIYGQSAEESFGFKSAMNSSGDVIALSGGFFANPPMRVVRVYQRSTGDWEQLGDDITAPSSETAFGSTLALSDDGLTLIVGSADDPMFKGTVRVYEFDGSSWALKGTPFVGNTNDRLGFDVDIDASGNIIVIGALGVSSGNPPFSKVSVYEFDGTNWIQVGDSISEGAEFNFLGLSVRIAADGMRIACSAGNTFSSAEVPGQIEVYDYNGSEWIPVGEPVKGPMDDFNYGRLFDMTDDGNAIVATSPSSDLYEVNGGLLQVFTYNGTDWIQKGSDLFGEPNSFLGRNLKIGNSGSLILVGSPDDNADLSFEFKGFAQFYRFDGNDWVLFGDEFVGDVGDSLGRSVEISNNEDRFLIGSPNADFEGNENYGLTRVFEFEDLGIDEISSNYDISFSPNPVDNQLRIAVDEELSIDSVSIFNAQGISVKKINFDNQKNIQSINLESLSSGIYFLQIHSENGRLNAKFLKR